MCSSPGLLSCIGSSSLLNNSMRESLETLSFPGTREVKQLPTVARLVSDRVGI